MNSKRNGGTLSKHSAWVWMAAALSVRLMVVVWAAGRFPPANDGVFYHKIAMRIAEGHGYTWLWPDGTVTYAAHYPVGYPALLGGLYWVGGARPWLAMCLAAAIGAVAVGAGWDLVARGFGKRSGWLTGVLLAVHPTLIGYVPAVMTEGVVASLLLICVWCADRFRRRGDLAAVVGLVVSLGVSTYMRPQVVLLAPVLGWLAVRGGAARRGLAAAGLSVAIVALCAPWTLRNCISMDRCAFVSANGGWNLFIGSAPKATGRWVSAEALGFPDECKTVWGEASKDACLGAAGLRHIRGQPRRWLSLAPAKLRATFDADGVAAWYLNTSNSTAFPASVRDAVVVLEAGFGRTVLLAAWLGYWLRRTRRNGARIVAGVIGGACVLFPTAWLLVLALAGLLVATGRTLVDRSVGWALVLTSATHAVFFGDGRYSIIVAPLIAVVAGTVLTRSAVPGDTPVGRRKSAPSAN